MIKTALVVATALIVISLSTTQVQGRNITAFVHFNEEAIKENDSNGQLSHQARYTVDGKNYSWWHHDMIEALYPDEADKGPLFDYVAERELMVADNASEICFEDMDQPGYRACGQINRRAENATEIHFSYPASWIPG